MGGSTNTPDSSDELDALLLEELERQEAEEKDEKIVVEEGSRHRAPSPKRQKREVKPQPATLLQRGGVCPPHPGYMGGICIRCGTLKPVQHVQDLTDTILLNGRHPRNNHNNNSNNKNTNNKTTSPIALRYIHHGLEVSREEALRLRASTVQRALASRRLLLILDLDHTLLHSTRFTDVTPDQEAALQARFSAQQGPSPNLLLHRIPHMAMWTKLRPGIRQFLSDARELFDLHVFTMGDKDYAAGMAALLDPDGRLFGGNVASSSDAGPSGVKDIDVLMGAEELVLVLDDTVGVWPKHKNNIMQIERYIYFPACAVRFGRGGQSLFERGEDEDPQKGALATSLRVLSEVHRRFFEQYDAQAADGDGGDRAIDKEKTIPDARTLLNDIRREILSGCRILFSRIIPRDTVDPSQHPYWKLATSMGAVCVREAREEVTHVVAADKTDKTKWAEGVGKRVVSPDWLFCCAFTWNRADESRFTQLGSGNEHEKDKEKEKGGRRSNQVPAIAASEQEDVEAALAAAGGGKGSGDDVLD